MIGRFYTPLALVQTSSTNASEKNFPSEKKKTRKQNGGEGRTEMSLRLAQIAQIALEMIRQLQLVLFVFFRPIGQ